MGEPRIQIYTTPICGYCVRAKSLLDRLGIAYQETDISDDDEKRRWLVEATGRRTVPQIFIDGKSIGGSEELHAMQIAGELDALGLGE